MKQADYLENEWPEDVLDKSEVPAEEAESDRGLYAIDTPVSEEEQGEPIIYAEEDDTLNGSDSLFRFSNDHKMYRMEDPPKIENAATNRQKAEICIRRHCDRTDPEDNQYLTAFLHYYEPTLNWIVSGFILRYAMLGHFEDLKQEAVIGILEAASDYDYAKKESFHNFTARSIENRMHDYTRRMRRGCTVESDYAYDRVRRVMAVFNRLGGHADMETLLAVSKETGISVIEAEEMIHAALRNMQCMDIYRSYGLYDGEAEESREEITVSPYPEPYEAFLEECQAKALCAAWESLDYREQEMLAAHLGFCPDCFGVLERTGHSEKWYDCVPRKKLPYKDIAISHGLSSPDSAQRICDHAIAKLRFIYEETYFRLLCLQS